MYQTIYQSGNTVRLTCTFKNFDGTLLDPDSLKVIIYDQKYTVIQTITNVVKESTGVYHVDYITPSNVNSFNQKYYYEWNSLIGGFPAIKRQLLVTHFVDS